eukprot:GHVU01016305.1.p1 GENE.GHVU01016305.1~~GHVU01016305.1.p1  ORF type:complete len:266 (+),score=15.07 GHVU01016305.1:361-1158(+)
MGDSEVADDYDFPWYYEPASSDVCVIECPATFPRFLRHLDSYDDMPHPSRYSEEGCRYLRHWAFLCTLQSSYSSHPLRPFYLCKDADGKMFNVAFYLDTGSVEFEYVQNILSRTFKKDRVLAIRHAFKKTFMDMTEGIRIEDEEVDGVMALPGSLQAVTSAAHTLFEKEPTGTENQCWGCGGKPEGGGATSKCSRCDVAQYCNRECQARDWEASHKQQCKVMNGVRELVGRGINKFDPRRFVTHVPFPRISLAKRQRPNAASPAV